MRACVRQVVRCYAPAFRRNAAADDFERENDKALAVCACVRWILIKQSWHWSFVSEGRVNGGRIPFIGRQLFMNMNELIQKVS